MKRTVKALRKSLDLTQQDFATILGLSFVTINLWENRKRTPTGLGEVLLALLEGALQAHAPDAVVQALRATDGSSLAIVRTLAELEHRKSNTMHEDPDLA